MKSKMSQIALGICLVAATSLGQGTKLDTAKIDEITGLKGKLNEQEGVFKVSSPRTDIKVILLEGIPNGVVPGFPGNFNGATLADQLRLNLAIAPTITDTNPPAAVATIPPT